MRKKVLMLNDYKIKSMVYLSSSTFFDMSANSIHVAKMSNAIAQNGLTIDLYTYHNKDINRDVYSEYNITSLVNLKNYLYPKVKSSVLRIFLSFVEINKINKKYDKNAFFYGRNPLMLFFAKLIYRRITVCEVHALPNSLRGNLVLGIILNKMDAIVVITEALKFDLMKKFNLSELLFKVLPDAADVVELNSNPKSKKERITVGYVGGFYDGRGIEFIIKISKSLPEIDFVLVGANDESYFNYNAQLTNKNLRIINYLPHSELHRYYEDFDIVLAPYSAVISTHGGAKDISRWISPLKLFEYMSYKKCMLVSNIPVFQEILKDGVNCIICDTDDTDDWINKIVLTASDKSLRDDLANNAYSDFLDNYTWEKRASKLIDFLSFRIYLP